MPVEQFPIAPRTFLPYVRHVRHITSEDCLVTVTERITKCLVYRLDIRLEMRPHKSVDISQRIESAWAFLGS